MSHSMLTVHKIDRARETVTLTLDFETIEFIGDELPRHDGMSRVWWKELLVPIADITQERDES